MKVNISYYDLSTIIEIVDRSAQDLQTRLQEMKTELREINKNTVDKWKGVEDAETTRIKEKLINDIEVTGEEHQDLLQLSWRLKFKS